MVDFVENGIDYLELVNSIDAKRVMIKEFWSINKSERFYGLRHDVDHDINIALEMAEFEYENDIQATYFLLHTAGYFDYSQEFADKCKKLVELGHDVGLHNNVLTVWLTKGGTIKDIIERPLNFLREKGMEITGTSCHGDPLCYKEKCLNYEIWKEFDKSSVMKDSDMAHNLKIEKVSLGDVGLKYEAYFLKYDAYLSDTGHHWIGTITDERGTMFENAAMQAPQNIGLKVITEFNEMEIGFFHVLLHPIWWVKK